MASVTLLLQQARAAGLLIRRDGEALVVRGPADVDHLARELLTHKPLLLAMFDRERECRDHEVYAHRGRFVHWWQRADGGLVCAVCHPAPGSVGGPAIVDGAEVTYRGELAGEQSGWVIWRCSCEPPHPSPALAVACAMAEERRRRARRRVGRTRDRVPRA